MLLGTGRGKQVGVLGGFGFVFGLGDVAERLFFARRRCVGVVLRARERTRWCWLWHCGSERYFGRRASSDGDGALAAL